MKNIRAFILCCSLLLVAWLTASYSTQPDRADSTDLTAAQSPKELPAIEQQDLQDNAKELTDSSSFARIE